MLPTYYNRYKCFFKPLDILPNRPTLILTKTYVNFTDQIYSKISSITSDTEPVDQLTRLRLEILGYHALFQLNTHLFKSIPISCYFRDARACFGVRGWKLVAGSYRAWQWGSGVEPLKVFTNVPIDCKKTPFRHQSTSYLR